MNFDKSYELTDYEQSDLVKVQILINRYMENDDISIIKDFIEGTIGVKEVIDKNEKEYLVDAGRHPNLCTSPDIMQQ